MERSQFGIMQVARRICRLTWQRVQVPRKTPLCFLRTSSPVALPLRAYLSFAIALYVWISRVGRAAGPVEFVSPWAQDYTNDITTREEAGTPNVIGDIRAALAFMVKDSIGQETITAREHELNAMAFNGWAGNPHMTMLGVDMPNRLPIFSFLVKDAEGRQIDPQVFTRELSARYGIQARGGCACAGPYGHRLLGIDRETSERLRVEILDGNEAAKPGWVRLNFSYLMSDETAQFIIDSINELTHAMAGAARISA